MKKQKKQSLLTTIIIILVIALIMMVGSIVYEEVININKQKTQNTDAPAIEDELIENVEDEDEDKPLVEDEKEEEVTEEEPTDKNDEYVGEEEKDTKEDTTQSKDEKAINLVKKEWGDDDSVTFSIDQKKGTKYYVAVKSQDNPTVWYEVDTETWEVSEY